MTEIETLKTNIKAFIHERDWEQYHDPKNLAMALSVEASEILEIYQWKAIGDPLSAGEREALKQEIGDVLIYLIELADKVGIDILAAAAEKLVLNAQKYPADLVRGKADKYTEYKG